MGELTLFEQYPIIQIISYFITTIIGVVGYKYVSLWLGYKKDKSDDGRETNQLLIKNLQNRINAITERVIELESERKVIYGRELKRTEELSDAKAQVKILSNKVQHLEESLKHLRIVVEAYQDKYGKLKIE